jgi:hypothetical protein
MYKYIEPEVAGELGKKTILDNHFHPPLIKKLNYEFHGWLGDDIIESFPCYIITEQLFNGIKSRELTGVTFDSVYITTSDEFKVQYPNKILPVFHWMKVSGEFGKDDFVIAKDLRLLISDKAFNLLNSFNIGNALIEEYKETI